MSLNRNTSNCIQSGNSSSGKEKKKSRVPSFLLWFNHKENQSVHKDKLQQARYNIEHDIINELIKQINEDDAAVSRPVTPYNYPTIRRTGSCESLLSIATNGFNYIRPDIYLESTHSNGRETNRQSVISEQDHFKSNLPSDGYYSDNNDRFDSLSHARRKRRAPPPPHLTGIEMNRYSDQILVRSVESNAETTSSSSLGRKKRKAPQPPVSPPPTLSTSEPVVIQSSDSSTASVLPLPLRPWYKRRSALKKDKEKCSTEVGSNQDLMQDNYFVRDLKSALILNRESVSSYINTPSISELDRQAAEIIKDDYKDEPSCSAPPRVNRSKSPRATDAKLKFFNTENTCNVTSNGNTNMNALNDDVNLMWTCPYCTLDNPIWRIICGACERMKVTNDIGILTNGKTDIVPSKCLNEPDMPIARETDINITARSNENYVTPKEFITTSSIENPDLPNLTKLAKREVEKNQKIVTTSMVENPDVPNLSKLAKQEIRKHRLAHFGPKQVNDDKTPADQRSDLTKEAKLEALEREKLRLRQLIDKMNAAAIADKEPKPDIEQSNLNLNTSNHQRGAQSKENVMEIVVNKVLITDQTKNRLGAIKKQLNPKLNASNELKNKANVQESTNLNIVSNDSNQLNATTTKAIDKHGNLKLNDLNKINSVYEKINPTKNITVNNLTDPKISLNNRSLITVTETYVDNVKTVSSSANRNTTDDTRTKCDTLKIDSDLRKLEFCIKSGDYENAAKLAAKLAKQKVNLSVIKGEPKFKKLDNTESIQVADPSEIKVELTVENNDGILEREAIQISPLLTIQQLKKKFHNELKYPIDQQRLRINGTTAIDESKILSEYCRDIDNSRVHVVLLTDKIFDDKGKLQRKRSITPTKAEDENFHIEDSDEEISESQNEAITNLDDILKGAEALPIEIDRDEWVCVLCTLINSKNRTCCAACSHVRPNQPIQNNKPITLDTKQSIVVKPSPILEQAAKSSNPNITRTKYRGVENFNPKHYKEYVVKDKETKEPVPNSDNESQIDPNFKLNIGNNHYMELVNLDSADIVPNIDEFECPICYLTIKKSDGVVLRDCLHSFCKDCLQGTVQHGEDAEISCPFRDNVYTCNSKLQEREIKAIVSKEIYDQHLARSLRQVEHQIKNAFHCKTPNCRGWCIYEDDVNRFKCPICKIVNCLTCRVIHDGLNCKQYQEQMDKNSENDVDAKNTMKMLQEMVDKGEAINCPICHVVLMKKWGCDWLKCSMCKTEICWVTRGPRWGPDGKGDTSGGCKCGVNGVKCHPKCNYCH